MHIVFHESQKDLEEQYAWLRGMTDIPRFTYSPK